MVLSRIKKPEDPEASSQEKLTEGEQLVSTVNRAVTAVTNRLNSLAHFDGLDSKVNTPIIIYTGSPDEYVPALISYRNNAMFFCL